MTRQGAMAGFTTDSRVLAFGLQLGLLGVAGFTDLASGKLDGPGTNVVHCARPEVAVLAEIGRNDRPADHQECNDPQDQ